MALVPGSSGSAVPGAASSSGGYEVHLNLGSIQGESSSSAHPDEIELKSFSWSGTNVPVRSAGGSTKGGRPSISEIAVLKSVDKASTKLWYALYSGEPVKTAIISVSKSTSGKKPEDYYIITLTNVFVTSIQLKSGVGDRDIGTESVTLSYDSVDQVYKRQGTDGLLTNAGAVSFNLAAGKTG